MKTNYEKAVKLNNQFKNIETIAKRATPEQLEIVPASLEFSAEGGKETVQITSNTSWNIQ